MQSTFDHIDLMDENPELAAILLREQAGGGQNFPEMVVKDLTRILANLRDILQEGKQKGVFRTTVPLIVHFMIIGTIILVKMSAPVRRKFAPLAFPLNIDTGKDGDEAAAEIEKLVLNAVRK